MDTPTKTSEINTNLDSLDVEQLHSKCEDLILDHGWNSLPQFEESSGKVLGLVLLKYQPVVDSKFACLTADQRIQSIPLLINS